MFVLTGGRRERRGWVSCPLLPLRPPVKPNRWIGRSPQANSFFQKGRTTSQNPRAPRPSLSTPINSYRSSQRKQRNHAVFFSALSAAFCKSCLVWSVWLRLRRSGKPPRIVLDFLAIQATPRPRRVRFEQLGARRVPIDKGTIPPAASHQKSPHETHSIDVELRR
jgi:hypothetical protein